MNHNHLKKLLMSCLALSQSYALAANVVKLDASQLPFLKKNFVTDVKGFSTITARDALKTVRVHKDFNGVSHHRLQQMFEGAPVIGGYAIVHSKKQAGLIGQGTNDINGKVYQSLSSDLDVKPTSEALKQALEQFKRQFLGKKLSEVSGQIVVYVDATNKAHWAYKLSVMTEDGQSIPKKPSVILDANNFKPFVEWDDIKQLNHAAKGKGYGGNELTGEYVFGEDFPYLDISRDDDTATCFLENTEVRVVDMGGDYYSNNAPMSFSCAQESAQNVYMTGLDSDGYDRANGGFSPTNDAMYDGYVIKHMYHDWYGLEVLTKYDGSPMQLVMRVHYGSDYENAYWDGKQMTFGDGADFFYPLVSLGVGAHEVSHGFTEQHSGLEYWGQSGGMNESFSDMAAQAAEYYSTGKASWLIGSRIVKPGSGLVALRYMEKPSLDGRSIDSAKDYYDGLNVHYSSGVYNRLFFLIANASGWSARKAFDVMVKANQDYWTPYATFETAGCGVINATHDYGYDDNVVLNAIHTVGISTSDC